MDKNLLPDCETQGSSEEAASAVLTPSLAERLMAVPRLSRVMQVLKSERTATLVSVLVVAAAAGVPDQSIIIHPG